MKNKLLYSKAEARRLVKELIEWSSQGTAVFSCRGPEDKNFRLCDHTISVTTTQILPLSIDKTLMNGLGWVERAWQIIRGRES